MPDSRVGSPFALDAGKSYDKKILHSEDTTKIGYGKMIADFNYRCIFNGNILKMNYHPSHLRLQ